MKTFPARYTGGLCLPCDIVIERGDEITHHPTVGYVHVHCYDRANDAAPELPAERRAGVVRTVDVMPRGKTARDRCDRCFLVHTEAQGDDCE
jgi:hypothetical protein